MNSYQIALLDLIVSAIARRETGKPCLSTPPGDLSLCRRAPRTGTQLQNFSAPRGGLVRGQAAREQQRAERRLELTRRDARTATLTRALRACHLNLLEAYFTALQQFSVSSPQC